MILEYLSIKSLLYVFSNNFSNLVFYFYFTSSFYLNTYIILNNISSYALVIISRLKLLILWNKIIYCNTILFMLYIEIDVFSITCVILLLELCFWLSSIYYVVPIWMSLYSFDVYFGYKNKVIKFMIKLGIFRSNILNFLCKEMNCLNLICYCKYQF